MSPASLALVSLFACAPAVALSCSSSSSSTSSTQSDASAPGDAALDSGTVATGDSSVTDSAAADSGSIADSGGSGAYSTTFPATENPISESSSWLNGAKDGIDWGDVRTTLGLAFGTVVSGGPPYSDSTAVLKGTWSSDQFAQATAHTANQTSTIFEEVELRLRSNVAAHNITGYEFNFRATADGSQYCQIVRWNGAINDFTPLNGQTGPGLHDGDVLKATAVGNTLTSYINGVQCVTATDTTFATGNPGVGFYNQGGVVGNNADYGFTMFSAKNGT